MKKYNLKYHRCLGDLCVSSAAHLSFLDQYPDSEIDVESKHKLVLQFDPNLKANNGETILLDYYSYLDVGLTMAEAYTQDLADKIGLPLKQTKQPQLFLSDKEKKPLPGLPKKYIVFNAGRKPDMTVKGIPPQIATAVVKNAPLPCVQIGFKHHNDAIPGAIDRRQATVRELIQLSAHATAGWGGDTALFHICGSLNVPYICIASGRSSPKWLDLYANQTLLTAFGELDCCFLKGCKLKRTSPIYDGSDLNDLLCKYPVNDYSKCMQMITADKILEALAKHC